MEINTILRTNPNTLNTRSVNRIESVNYNNELKSDTVNFSGKNKKAEVIKPKKSSIAHKAVVAMTSAVIPGVGQAINGQWGKALLCYAGFDLTATAVFLATGNPFIAGAIAMGGRAFTVIDAYRNA